MMETMLKHPSSDEDVDVSHALKTSTWRVDADIVLSSFIMCYGYWLSKVGLIASVACTLSEHFGIFVCYKCIFSLCYWYLFWKGCSTACEKTQCSLLVCFFTYHVGARRSAYLLLITFGKFELLPRQPVISSGLELCSHTGWDLLAMVEMGVFFSLGQKVVLF